MDSFLKYEKQSVLKFDTLFESYYDCQPVCLGSCFLPVATFLWWFTVNIEA